MPSLKGVFEVYGEGFYSIKTYVLILSNRGGYLADFDYSGLFRTYPAINEGLLYFQY